MALPAGYFAWRLNTTRSAQKLLAMGVGKFVTTCALLVVAMIVLAPSPLALFTALIAAQLMYVVIPLAGGRG